MGPFRAEDVEQADGVREQGGEGVVGAPAGEFTDRPVSRWS